MIKNIQSRLTPISHEYPSCDECYASLLIYTGNTHTNEISIHLELEPTSINIKGDEIITLSGKKRYAKKFILDALVRKSSELERYSRTSGLATSQTWT